MSSWKAYCSRRSATSSRVVGAVKAVLGSIRVVRNPEWNYRDYTRDRQLPGAGDRARLPASLAAQRDASRSAHANASPDLTGRGNVGRSSPSQGVAPSYTAVG